MKEPYLSHDGIGPEFTDALRERFLQANGTKSRRLYIALFDLLCTGSVPADSRLPATRNLASELALGRNTVTQAYQQMVDEGLLYTARRGGTRVSGDIPPGGAAGRDTEYASKRRSPAGLSDRARARRLLMRPRALCPGEPDPSLFPKPLWSRALATAARDRQAQLGYRYDAGEQVLRAAIVRYLARWRSLTVDPEQVLITASTRQSLGIAACLYANPGDTAFVESPGYSGAGDAWRMLGLTLQPLDVDALGLVPPPDMIGAKLLYATPCFQYPLGHALAPARRASLLVAAANAGTVVFEDDYDSEFRDRSQPRPALAGEADTSGATVLHAGTFSKLIFPAVRLGWLVLPRDHVQAGIGVMRTLGGGHNTVHQKAVAALLDSGVVAKHLARARSEYGRRRTALVDALRQGPLRVRANSGGLSLVLDLPRAVSRDALAKALRLADLGPQPIEELQLDPGSSETCSALVLGTGNLDIGAIPAAVDRLYAAWHSVD